MSSRPGSGTSSPRSRPLVLAGPAAFLVLTLVTILAAALRPDYSHLHQFVSELGASGTSRAALMNVLGLVPTGMLVAAFGLALGATLPRHPLHLLGATLVVLFGAGIVAVGILPCDVGCPQSGGSLDNRLHNRIAPAAFVSLIGAAGVLAVRFRRLPGWRDLGVYSAVSAVLGIVFLAGLASSLESRLWTGLWQRLLLIVLFGWCAVVGLRAHRLLARTR